MNYQKNIGKAIVRLRSSKGVSQEKMALEANIDRRYMSDIENGKRNVSIQILYRIANVFNMTLSNLIYSAEELQ